MSEDDRYLYLTLPATAPFELKPTTGRGWGAFATRHIEKDHHILTEQPLFTFSHKSNPERPTNSPDSSAASLRRSADNIIKDLSTSDKILVDLLLISPSLAPGEALNAHLFQMHASVGEDTYGFFVLMSRFNHSCYPNAGHVNADVALGDIEMSAKRDIAKGEEIEFHYNPELGEPIRFDGRCLCKACRPGT